MSRNLSLAILVSVAGLGGAYALGVFPWVFFVAILIGTVGSVVFPIVRSVRESWEFDSPSADQLKRLYKEKAIVLRMLKDLEFEREVGTVDGDEFEILWTRYKKNAARLNREIDALREADPPASGPPPSRPAPSDWSGATPATDTPFTDKPTADTNTADKKTADTPVAPRSDTPT